MKSQQNSASNSKRPSSTFRSWRDPETGERMVVTEKGSPFYLGSRLEIPSPPSLIALAEAMRRREVGAEGPALPAQKPESKVQIKDQRGIQVG